MLNCQGLVRVALNLPVGLTKGGHGRYSPSNCRKITITTKDRVLKPSNGILVLGRGKNMDISLNMI